MVYKCPGQDYRFLTINYIAWPVCAHQAEIFSDETKVRCPSCKYIILKEQLPSCVNWCKAAKACIGEERWEQISQGGRR